MAMESESITQIKQETDPESNIPLIKTEEESEPEDVPDLIEIKSYKHENSDKKHSCKLCNKSFTRYSSLRVHVRKQICQRVLEKTRSIDDTQIDETVSIRRRKLKCHQCNKFLTGITSYQRHMSVHAGERQFSCDQCDKTFNLKSSLKKHHLTHRTKHYECDVCAKVLKSEKFLRNHRQQHADDKKFTCPVCRCSFGLMSSFKMHQTTHKERTFKCAFCGKIFLSERFLENHERQHRTEGRFDCGLCRASFGLESSLKRHRIVHEAKLFKCAVCAKNFVSQRNLDYHELEHSSTVTYDCGECRASFASLSNLKRHEFKHKPDFMRYRCESCPKIFSSAATLDRHLASHDGGSEKVRNGRDGEQKTGSDSKSLNVKEEEMCDVVR